MRSNTQNASIGVAPSAGGLDIVCRYFWQIGLPEIEARFPEQIDRLAGGLVASGSDCSGNDDEISRDFDWGPRFQVFLSHDDFVKIGAELQRVISDLPTEFEGVRCHSSVPCHNIVFDIDSFFIEKTSGASCSGFASAPQTASDWLKIEESQLFELTSGMVFYDPLGEFTSRRREFAAYYNDEAWRVKLSAALTGCGRYGQEILPRALARDDHYTSQMAWWRFSEYAMRLGFALNRRYAPGAKWLYREFCKMPGVSVEVVNALWEGQGDVMNRPELVGRIAAVYDIMLRDCGICSTMLDDHQELFMRRAEEVASTVLDYRLVEQAACAEPAEVR